MNIEKINIKMRGREEDTKKKKGKRGERDNMHAYAMHFASESLCGDAVSAIELN